MWARSGKLGEKRTLRGLFGTSRYSTAGAAFMSRSARCSSTTQTPETRQQEPSEDSPGRVAVAFGPFCVWAFHNFLSSSPERAFVCGYYTIHSKQIHVCARANGTHISYLPIRKVRRRPAAQALTAKTFVWFFLPLQNACTTHATPPQPCRTQPNPSSSR